MQPAPTMPAATAVLTAPLAWPLLLVSAGTLAFEITLMRVLLIASWHHFAFLVISIGLLGFGLSGTVLLLCRGWLLPRAGLAIPALAAATAASMPLCVAAAQHVPIAARVLPALFFSQASAWIAYWLILTVPFLLAATTIGLGLIAAQDRLPSAYAANLVGSGAGAVIGTGAMWLVDPAWLASLCGAITLLGALSPSGIALSGRVGLAAGILAIVGIVLRIDPPRIRVDEFKYSAYVDHLMQQGDAARIARRLSPRGTVEVFGGRAFHELAFLELGSRPPPLHALTVDGHFAGSVLNVASIDQAAPVDHTMMSLPFDLLPVSRPRVALLGDRGTANVWLAARRQAARIDVVQPDSALSSIQRLVSPAVRTIPGLNLVNSDPRRFLDRPGAQYDLIHFASLEGSAAGSGGIAGLGQDYLVTVEGFSAALGRLDDDGILSVCRGIQSPPRDNLKLFATIAAALRAHGVADPGRHVVIVRDYLGVCTMARRSPWPPDQLEQLRELSRIRQFTPVWFEGVRDDELNRPDEMPGPAGSPHDWYHHAAGQIFSTGASAFIDRWQFDIRPPTDDRPFFLDFCRLRAIADLRGAFGDLWLTRAELAFLFVLAAAGIIAVVAAITVLGPPLLMRRVRRSPGLWVTGAYFASIGLAYLMLEVTLLSRFMQLIGDPVLAAATTIATFLCGSGAGSLLIQRVSRRETAVVSAAVAGITLLTASIIFLIGWVSVQLAGSSDTSRIAAAAAMMLPLSVLMGMPMPTALRRLHRGAPDVLPWAWGVNGFASVLAGPLCTAIAMTSGFTVAAVLALALYAAAAILLPRLPAYACDFH